MCWLTAYLTEQYDKGAEAAGREAAPVLTIDDFARRILAPEVARVRLMQAAFNERMNAAEIEAIKAAGPGPVYCVDIDTGAPLISEILAAMDIPPAEPAPVFNYETQQWETPGAVEPPKPEPCAIIPAADEYSVIGARLREIEAEKRAALERMSAD
jgi:hypothetical protein